MPRYGAKPPQRKFEPVEAGLHVAWLVQFIDFGTHLEDTGQWGKKEQRKGRLVWALPDSLMDDGRPRIISKRNMTLSPHAKSNFRKDIERWTKRAFSDSEFLDFDEAELFSIPCLLNVAHRQMDDGTVMAFIQDVLPLMGKTVPTELPADQQYLYISLEADRFNEAEYAKIDTVLTEKAAAEVKGKIESSPEWAALFNQPADQPEAEGEWHTEDPIDDAQPQEPEYVEPEPAPAPAPVRQAARPVAAAPGNQGQQGRPVASGSQAPRQAAPVAQRPAAPLARPSAPQAQARPAAAAAAAPQRATGPAPSRPAAGPGSISARAAGRPAPTPSTQQRSVTQRSPDKDIVEDEIPF